MKIVVGKKPTAASFIHITPLQGSSYNIFNYSKLASMIPFKGSDTHFCTFRDVIFPDMPSVILNLSLNLAWTHFLLRNTSLSFNVHTVGSSKLELRVLWVPMHKINCAWSQKIWLICFQKNTLKILILQITIFEKIKFILSFVD